MVPTFRHGKQARTLLNNVDMSDILTAATIESSVGTAETATHGDNDMSYIVGLSEGTASFEGLFDGTALNRGVKRYDNQSPAGFLAAARIRQAQVQRAALLSFHSKESSYKRPTAGILPIRSPPFQLPL